MELCIALAVFFAIVLFVRRRLAAAERQKRLNYERHRFERQRQEAFRAPGERAGRRRGAEYSWSQGQ